MIVQNSNNGKSTPPSDWYDERLHNQGTSSKEAYLDKRIPLTKDGKPDTHQALTHQALIHRGRIALCNSANKSG
jgi:hypothetical protein